jgi:hypothetical protein
MLIPSGYASVAMEQICQPQFEDLQLDIPGGHGERTLKDVVHVSYCGQMLHYNPPDGGINPSYRSPTTATITISEALQYHLAHHLHKIHYSIPEVRALAMIMTSIPNHLQKSRKTNGGKASAIKSRKNTKASHKNHPTTKAHPKTRETTTEKTT